MSQAKAINIFCLLGYSLYEIIPFADVVCTQPIP